MRCPTRIYFRTIIVVVIYINDFFLQFVNSLAVVFADDINVILPHIDVYTQTESPIVEDGTYMRSQ